MSFFSRFSPIAAYRDLRFFLSRRQPHQLVFFAAALGVAAYLVIGLESESNYTPPYRPNIIYVQQWRADRTDAQIKVQQAIDQAAKDRRLAAEKAEDDRGRRLVREMNAKVKAWGL